MIMITSKIKKIVASGLLITACISVGGCGLGAKGESEATDLAKQVCKIPDSFKKVSYNVDEKGNLAWLDFKAKNPMGVEIPGRIYFTFENNKIRMIDTQNIDKNILEKFAKTDPAKFEECVKSYSRLKKEVDSWNFTMKFLNNQLEQMKLSQKNYFGWQSLERTATQYNAKLKPILDVYEKAPAVVQKEFPNLKDAEYLKVDLQGDYFSWNVKTDWTKDYSALGNGSN